jgi:hypothetical protein
MPLLLVRLREAQDKYDPHHPEIVARVQRDLRRGKHAEDFVRVQ